MTAAATTTWRNWAGDQVCTPRRIARPTSTAEVAGLVRAAARDGLEIRVAGSGHSFTDAVLTDGLLLDLRRLNNLIAFDPATGIVRTEAGISLHDLSLQLAENGRALHNLGDIDAQALAGALATGTHGTGARLRNLSHAVIGVRAVLADGSVIDVGADDPALRGWRVSVGALGVITEVTLQTVPAFVLHSVEGQERIDSVLGSLDALAESNDHFEFFAFPHSPLALTRRNNRTDAPAKPVGRTSAYVNEVLLGNHAFGAACRTGRRFPAAIPAINRTVSKLAGSRERTDWSHRIFANPRLIRFTEMEYAVPRENGAEAVRRVFECIDTEGFQVPFPIEVRFVAGDDAWLSPAQGRATCYIAVHMYEGMPWRDYFRAVEAIMDGFDGRPHWGKRHFQTAETLRTRYPHWDDFDRLRRELDPDGRFANGYVRRVLAGARVPEAVG